MLPPQALTDTFDSYCMHATAISSWQRIYYLIKAISNSTKISNLYSATQRDATRQTAAKTDKIREEMAAAALLNYVVFLEAIRNEMNVFMFFVQFLLGYFSIQKRQLPFVSHSTSVGNYYGRQLMMTTTSDDTLSYIFFQYNSLNVRTIIMDSTKCHVCVSCVLSSVFIVTAAGVGRLRFCGCSTFGILEQFSFR